MEAHKTLRILNSTTKALKSWNRNSFGNVQTRIKELECELHALHSNDN